MIPIRDQRERVPACRSELGASAYRRARRKEAEKRRRNTATRPGPKITWHSCSSKHQRATEGCRQRAQKRGPPRHGPSSRAPRAMFQDQFGRFVAAREGCRAPRTPHLRGPTGSYVLRRAFRVLRPGSGRSPPDRGARISRPRSRDDAPRRSYLSARARRTVWALATLGEYGQSRACIEDYLLLSPLDHSVQTDLPMRDKVLLTREDLRKKNFIYKFLILNIYKFYMYIYIYIYIYLREEENGNCSS